MIKFTNEAEDFLRSKHKTAVTIEYPSYRANCCAYTVPLPEIFAKPPKEQLMTNYKQVTIDGITIYIARDVIWPEKNYVTISLEKILGFKQLRLEGFDLSEIMNA